MFICCGKGSPEVVSMTWCLLLQRHIVGFNIKCNGNVRAKRTISWSTFLVNGSLRHSLVSFHLERVTFHWRPTNSIQTATVLKVIKMWTVLIKWQLFNGLKGLMSCSSNRHTDSLSCRDGVMWLQKQKTFIHSPPWKKEAIKKFAQVPLSDDGKHLIETYLPVIWGMKRKRL